jgi:hypothetical protein
MEPLAMDDVSPDHRTQRSPQEMTTKNSGPGDTHIFVDGIVAQRDQQPYVCLTVNGEKAQLSVAEAHKLAKDLLVMAARTEADAMILSFFSDQKFPTGAAAALMQEFRYFRQRQDDKPVEQTIVDPDSGEAIR